MSKVCVITSGSWGTAISIMLAGMGHDVTLWSYTEQEAQQLSEKGENPLLKGIKIPDSITITNNENTATKYAEYIVNTTVSKYTREILARFIPYINQSQIIINMSKGLEDNTLLRLSEIVCEVFPKNRVAVLSGPSHAEEVGRGKPTTCVAACINADIAQEVQTLFMNPTFRVYTSTDVIGVEMGGTLKNVIALAAGICDGLELGDNAKAGMITRGIAEISRLGEAMGANRDTFLGLAGIGDLIVTCCSMHSRNRRAGILLGRGESLRSTIEQIGTVEGINTARAALALAKQYDVEMPITEEINNFLFEGKSLQESMIALLTREKKAEYK